MHGNQNCELWVHKSHEFPGADNVYKVHVQHAKTVYIVLHILYLPYVVSVHSVICRHWQIFSPVSSFPVETCVLTSITGVWLMRAVYIWQPKGSTFMSFRVDGRIHGDRKRDPLEWIVTITLLKFDIILLIDKKQNQLHCAILLFLSHFAFAFIFYAHYCVWVLVSIELSHQIQANETVCV